MRLEFICHWDDPFHWLGVATQSGTAWYVVSQHASLSLKSVGTAIVRPGIIHVSDEFKGSIQVTLIKLSDHERNHDKRSDAW